MAWLSHIYPENLTTCPHSCPRLKCAANLDRRTDSEATHCTGFRPSAPFGPNVVAVVFGSLAGRVSPVPAGRTQRHNWTGPCSLCSYRGLHCRQQAR